MIKKIKISFSTFQASRKIKAQAAFHVLLKIVTEILSRITELPCIDSENCNFNCIYFINLTCYK